MDLITGGHYDKKGYYYRLFLNFPSYNNVKCINILKQEHRVKTLKLETGFILTNSNNYIKISISILGFGMGLEINIREEF